MPESYIVDESAFDKPADIKPGIYDESVFDKDTQPTEETFRGKMARYSEYLPMAGAMVGGGLSMAAAPGTLGASLAGGSMIAGLGAAAGKAGEQIVKAVVGEDAPKTSMEAAGQIAKEGALTALLNATGAKIMSTLAPTGKLLAKQIMRGFSRINEQTAIKVLNEPDILTKALPMSEAKKIFSDFFKDKGFVYGERSVKEATGKLTLSDNAADDLISDTISRIEGLPNVAGQEVKKEVIQQALAARYSVKDALSRAARSGNDSKMRIFMEGKRNIDNWLETQLPGFSDVRKIYENSKIRVAFDPIFPLNKNKETSVLGVLSALGGSLTTGGVLGPVAAIPVAVASSPKLTGMAIKVAPKVAKPSLAAASELAADKIIDKE